MITLKIQDALSALLTVSLRRHMRRDPELREEVIRDLRELNDVEGARQLRVTL